MKKAWRIARDRMFWKMKSATMSANGAARSLAVMVRLLHEKGIVSDDEVQGLLRRERTRVFTRTMVNEMAKGKDSSAAAIEAVKVAIPKYALASDEKALKRAVTELERPEVCVAIESLYESRGFKTEEAADLHIGHMKSGNYQAVKDYLGSVFPKQTTKIEGKMVGLFGVLGEGAPQMNARRLSEAKVVELAAEQEEPSTELH